MGRISDLATFALATVGRIRTRGRGDFHNGRPEALAVILERSLREAKRIAFRQDSTIVVSQPKSGRTWLRFMLDRLGLHLRYQHPSGCTLPDEWRGKKIIFLYRDPRDAVVSHWYHATRRHGFYDGSLSDFILDPEWGLESVIRCNLYWKSVVDASDRGLALAYEDLHADAAGAIQRVAHFVLGRTYGRERVARIVEEGRFERMREAERSGRGARLYGHMLEPADPGDESSYKTRRGAIGAWKAEFTPTEAALADRLLQDHDYFRLMSSRAE